MLRKDGSGGSLLCSFCCSKVWVVAMLLLLLLWFCFLVSFGSLYFTVRCDDFLGFVKDGLLQKNLPRMFSVIKNESWRVALLIT